LFTPKIPKGYIQSLGLLTTTPVIENIVDI
jgi:hypothetical protein